jgi:hypothetical protein
MQNLLDDLESGALTVTRRGAVQDRADGMNRLAVATDDAANVALAKLDFEHGHFAAGNFREHHVVGKFDQLTNDELEKFFHNEKLNHEPAAAQGYGVAVDTKYFVPLRCRS